jgi:hypothetical protein
VVDAGEPGRARDGERGRRRKGHGKDHGTHGRTCKPTPGWAGVRHEAS